jgi:hypothetical protein
MARTLTQVRQLTAQQTKLQFITGTADVGGSTTTLRDAILQVHNNDRLIGLHIILTSGSPTLTELVITDSVQSHGTVTFRPTLGADPASLTYEILPFSGTEFTRAIQDAGLLLYNLSVLTRPHLSYVHSGSPIYNADWGYWDAAATVDGWTLANSTMARERGSSHLYSTPTSVKLTSTAGTLTLDTQWARYLFDLQPNTVKLHVPVKSDTGSSARINLNNGSNNYSPYHTGNSQWQILTVEVDTSYSDTTLYPQLVHANSGANDYFGMPWIESSVQTQIPVPLFNSPEGPTSIQGSPTNLSADELASGIGVSELFRRHTRNVDYDFFRQLDENSANEYGIIVPRGSINMAMEMHGNGPLTVPTANTDYLEVSHQESLLLATQAAVILLEGAALHISSIGRRELDKRLVPLKQRLELLIKNAAQGTDVAPLPSRW